MADETKADDAEAPARDWHCNRERPCEFLDARIVVRGVGFHRITSLDLNSTVGNPQVALSGITYHASKDDRMWINFCPFCGGKPGIMANDGPAPKTGTEG